MRTLVTFPGRAGDLLWSLVTVRALAESLGEPVDLQIGGEFEGLLPLLSRQPYIRVVIADSTWSLTPPNEWDAPLPPSWATPYDRRVQLGYRGWPEHPLPHQIALNARAECPDLYLPPVIDGLQRPWIAVPPLGTRTVAVGFTEEWFELKLGLLHCLRQRWMACQAGCRWTPLMVPKGRWETEGGFTGCSWLEAAGIVAGAEVVLADCSAPHVLAVAMGKPVVVMEPSEARRNSIFYPLGDRGPQVTLVRGGDGEATWDARHVAETLDRVRGVGYGD